SIVFHTLKSYQSFSSVTDLAKLINEVYDPTFKCRKSKAHAIFRGVLAPSARAKLANELKMARFITIHFDCSNHGDIKLLSILARFFNDNGDQTRVLDVHEVPGETAEILAEFIIKSMEKWEITEKVIAICADNAS